MKNSINKFTLNFWQYLQNLSKDNLRKIRCYLLQCLQQKKWNFNLYYSRGNLCLVKDKSDVICKSVNLKLWEFNTIKNMKTTRFSSLLLRYRFKWYICEPYIPTIQIMVHLKLQCTLYSRLTHKKVLLRDPRPSKITVLPKNR